MKYTFYNANCTDLTVGCARQLACVTYQSNKRFVLFDLDAELDADDDDDDEPEEEMDEGVKQDGETATES